MQNPIQESAVLDYLKHWKYIANMQNPFRESAVLGYLKHWEYSK
jgi:hypothetical protein